MTIILTPAMLDAPAIEEGRVFPFVAELDALKDVYSVEEAITAYEHAGFEISGLHLSLVYFDQLVGSFEIQTLHRLRFGAILKRGDEQRIVKGGAISRRGPQELFEYFGVSDAQRDRLLATVQRWG